MQEFQIDTSDFQEFWKRWGKSIEQIPDMKKAILEKIGDRVQDEVRSRIDSSGLSDHRGRVKLWQKHHVGSGSGYVAIRSDSVEVLAGYRRKSDGLQTETLNAGALTNFLTSGHRVRGPSGRTKRYQPRARMTRVKGYDFYAKAQAEAEKIAVQEAEDFLRRLAVEELKL